MQLFPIFLWWRGRIECLLPWELLKLLNFREHDLVLRESRKLDQPRYEGAKLMIFPDYSVDTQKQRCLFDQVKLNLWNNKIKYSMLFSARLQVQDGEMVRFLPPLKMHHAGWRPYPDTNQIRDTGGMLELPFYYLYLLGFPGC